MGVDPRLFFGRVSHARLSPRPNRFAYGVYYLVLPLGHLKAIEIAHNRPASLSFYDRDHGHCDGSNLQEWARHVIAKYDTKAIDGDITLICMPRIFGYVFNPVSFWLSRDRSGNLRHILCEVNNTFGERHTYFCAHEDHRPILPGDRFKGEKVFHVSPFLKREGYYEFRFDVKDESIGIWIDYFNAEGKKQLVTSLEGRLLPMNRKTLRNAFWSYPLVTFKAIGMIHWQAMKLLFRGIRFMPKPHQLPDRVSSTNNLKKL